ncbi:MAG: glycosyltransferase [Chloracidobacterium sp.]|nr:glycosyltransferase [Chloracidobacterium sp.]MDW8217981.1 glycosyltransferase [Acidobacteriota bacterium]
MTTEARYAPVSLVTTVLNDLAGCQAFFAAMEAQTLCPREIIIVDGGSRDGTWAFLQEYRPRRDYELVVAQEVGCNVARGRNLAIARARYDVIVSTDVGCRWDDRWLEDLVRPLLDDPTLDAVMGSWAVRREDLPDDDWARVEFAFHADYALRARPDSHASSRAIAYRKALWERLGGYPEDLTLAADDMVFALLLHATTKRVAAAPTPRCFWERPATLRRFRREAERNFFGAGEADIWRKHGLLVGGRLIAETAAPLLGLSIGLIELWLGRWPFVGGSLFVIGAMLVSARLWRLRPAAARYAAAGGAWVWPRVIWFEYAVKWAGVRGYWRGWWTGRRRCQACRARLRQVGVSPW